MSRPAYSPIAYQQIAYPEDAYPQDPGPALAYPRTAYRLAAETRPARRSRRRFPLPAFVSLAALTVAGWVLATHPYGHDPVPAAGATAPAGASADRSPAGAPHQRPSARPDIAWMLDRAPTLGTDTAAFGSEAPPAPAFRVAAAPVPPEPSPAIREIARTLAETRPEPVRIAEAAPAPTPAARSATLVPLPVSRPPELGRPETTPARRMAARTMPRTRDVFRAAMAPEPSFLEKLFGTGTPSDAPRQALAYANPDGLPQASPRARISPSPEASPFSGTAVYDISARTVTLPSGEVLEAHSGLGEAMDDPRYVHLRMRGSTPPGTYDLTERERLFHGVRAIRLNPVGGSGAIHGRDGLLAHTYMLRQPGASNGCVSFRNYDRFLQAFLRGEVRRLVVVAGGRGDFFGRRIGMSDRAGGGA